MIAYFCLFLFVGIFIFEVDGQCTDATRPLLINATYSPQYISSPNYPNDYELDEDCAWIIRSPSPYDKIIINIEEVETEGSSLPCKYDYVAVYDGEDTSAEEVARLCNMNNDAVNALVSSTDVLYVTFVSDWAFNYAGFNMLIFTNDTNYQPDCDGNTTYVATHNQQVIMSPNLPDVYQSNFSCILRFYPEVSYFATSFELVFLDMESTPGCISDGLRFISVGETLSIEKAAECSTAVTYQFDNFPLEVSGSYVEVNFTTDADNNYLGFLLTYVQVFKGINLTSPENGGTIDYTVAEDLATGHINESVCVVVLTYTGTLDLTITPSYEATTDQNITLGDTQIFSLTDSPPYLYLGLTSSLDYEVINKFSLLVTFWEMVNDTESIPFQRHSWFFNMPSVQQRYMRPRFKVSSEGSLVRLVVSWKEPVLVGWETLKSVCVKKGYFKMIDTDVTQVTYTVTFNITITDVDDVAPTFDNLPGNYTVLRNQKTGELLYTVNATDADGTAENRQILFQIDSGDTDSMFVINETSGEVRLQQDANLVPLTTLSYDLTIAAYSGGTLDSKLVSTSTLTIDVSPDSPPECSHDTVWADTLDVNLAEAGTAVQLIDTWNCSDDNINITYSIESVSPNLTATLFDIDDAGDVTLLRAFNITEVVNRQFMLEIGVADSIGQMVTFHMYMNVTALTCLPNPRNLYVRMDQDLDSVILSDFNCTNKYGLTYILRQYPPGTFEVNSAVNGTAFLILKASVVKIKFYSLTITITDGVDIANLQFKVIVQTKRCGIASASSSLHVHTSMISVIATAAALVFLN